MKGNEKGFTLVELVVVISILGILSAVAIPKFISLEKEARVASLNGMLGAVKSASMMVNALAVAQNKTDEVTIEGQDIGLFGQYAETTDINKAVNFDENFTFSSNGRFTLRTNCYVSYQQPASSTNSVPTITSVTTGC